MHQILHAAADQSVKTGNEHNHPSWPPAIHPPLSQDGRKKSRMFKAQMIQKLGLEIFMKKIQVINLGILVQQSKYQN